MTGEKSMTIMLIVNESDQISNLITTQILPLVEQAGQHLLPPLT